MLQVYAGSVKDLISQKKKKTQFSQPARNSCPRLPHSVDSRFGLYRVAVVLSFLRSPALQKFESLKKLLNAKVHTTQELNSLVTLSDLSCERPRARRHSNVKIQN